MNATIEPPAQPAEARRPFLDLPTRDDAGRTLRCHVRRGTYGPDLCLTQPDAAEETIIAVDWFLGSMQLLVYEPGNDEGPVVMLRFNPDGTVAEVVLEPHIPDALPEEETAWTRTRDAEEGALWNS